MRTVVILGSLVLVLAGCGGRPLLAGALEERARNMQRQAVESQLFVGMTPDQVVARWGYPWRRYSDASVAGVVSVWLYCPIIRSGTLQYDGSCSRGTSTHTYLRFVNGLLAGMTQL